MRKFGPIRGMSRLEAEALVQLLGFVCDLPSRPLPAVVVLRLHETERGELVFEEAVPADIYDEDRGMRRLIEEAVGRSRLPVLLLDDHVIIDREDSDEVTLSELEDVE